MGYGVDRWFEFLLIVVIPQPDTFRLLLDTVHLPIHHEVLSPSIVT